jgi:hypothetical protein
LNNWKKDCAPNWDRPSATVTDPRSVPARASPIQTAADTSATIFRPPHTASYFPNVPRLSAPTCAALALTYNLCELNTEGFPFAFSSSCFPSLHPYPPSTTAQIGRSDLPPRPPSPQGPPPKLTIAPRPLSRRPPLLLRPAAGVVPPLTRATVDGPYLVSSSIHRFSLRFTATTTASYPLTLLPCAGAPEGARSLHYASTLPAPTPFTSESHAPHAIFHPPSLAAASHLMSRFSTRSEAREVAICRNHSRRR